MMSGKRTALVIGATGLAGGHLLQRLLESARYDQVICLVRRALPVKHPILTTHIVDFEQPETFSEKCGAEDLFCTFGTTMAKAGSEEMFRRIDLDIPRASVAAGAQRMFHVSSIGADLRSRFFYLRSKGELEIALQQLPFQSLAILRPATLIGERIETRRREELGLIAARLLTPFLRGRWRKYRSIRAETVARAMLNLAGMTAAGVRIIESDEIEAIGTAANFPPS